MTQQEQIIKLTAAIEVLRSMRTRIVVLLALRSKISTAYPNIESYRIVMDGSPIDSFAKTYRAAPEWKPAWEYVSATVNAQKVVFPPPGLTLTSAVPAVDALLVQGEKKLAALNTAAAATTAKAAADASATEAIEALRRAPELQRRKWIAAGIVTAALVGGIIAVIKLHK